MADCTPQALAAAASCLRCIPKRRPVRTYLLCEWANKPTCDPDALAFIAKAGITDATQIAAICQLVLSLKTLPVVGTKYWDRDSLIYPLTGWPTGYASHSINLKNPAASQFLEGGLGPPVYSANGVTGVVANQTFLNTQFLIPAGMQNNVRVMVYVHAAASTNFYYYFGCANSVPAFSRIYAFFHGGFKPFIFEVNSTGGGAGPFNVAALGAYFIQRNNDAANEQAAYGVVPWGSQAQASTGVEDRYIYLLAHNGAGASPSGTAANWSDATICGFSVGSALSNAERLEYKGIWDAYETALGRGHP